jgi:CRP-like cAMP-binding protein
VLGAESRSALLEVATERRPQRGQSLFNQGCPHTRTFFVRSGLVKTYYLSPEGREMTLAYWSSGGTVGGPDLFADSMHLWSAAVARDAVILEVSGDDLERLFFAYPDMAGYLAQVLAFKCYWLSMLLQIMSTGSVTDRMAHLLVQLGKMYGEETPQGVTISHMFSQEDLAGMVGASRQWVNQTLKDFQTSGLVSIDRRRITLVNIDALSRPPGYTKSRR